MLDLSNLPTGGGVVAGAFLYVALAVGGGDLIGSRMIEREHWLPRCEAAIRQSAEVSSPANVPDINCGILGAMLGPDGNKFCSVFGSLIDPIVEPLREEKRRLAELDILRSKTIRDGASSRCACAANLVLDERFDWSVYAGSLRLITPATVRNLDAELSAALRSPLCAMEGSK